ncbi:RE1-silencing transcription factor-like [Drosophila innubila]|uniref:RE1-silencing transcription factor-like n=1 Tax=Drosophila innubila TaxID=198719 RepID=UPI00148C43FE|nr:RE1-silencing transcription factor-like [Drosophila innubila]
MDDKRKYSVIFRCAVPKCLYTTKRLYNLHRHAKTHKKEHWRSKRFPCPCCAYAAATRAHLKRHMGNKHPTEDIAAHDLTGLAYEDLEQMEKSKEEQELTELMDETDQKEEFIEGPVTVLQMVTPLNPESEPLPGQMYCNVTLEGEAFRLIPVALLPAEAAAKEL